MKISLFPFCEYNNNAAKYILREFKLFCHKWSKHSLLLAKIQILINKLHLFCKKNGAD